MSIEVNVASVFRNKIRQLVKFFGSEDWKTKGSAETFLASATALDHLPSGSVDYVFTDPPFGSNIFYADCALIAEGWLGQLTDVRQEAVARVLKRGGTATVVFQNTDADVWTALEDSLAGAGLACERANTLDKTQQSHKGYKGRSGAEDVAGFDMVLTVRHQRQRSKRKPDKRRVEDAVSVLSTHLSELPALGSSLAADRQRTLPFLYAVLLQAHFNGDIGALHRRRRGALVPDGPETCPDGGQD